MKKIGFLKNWELALLLALCISTLSAAWAEKHSSELSEGLVRLHVIAVSNDDAEQAVKLRVRDAVLSYLAPRLEGAADAKEARLLLESERDGILAAAEGAAEGRGVSVTMGDEYYPSRYYEGFALPAGEYRSLRVILGEGAGRNWWCVVFPPLCLAGAEGEDAMETLSDEDAAIITEDGGGYVIKFKLLELWGELKNALKK